MNGTKLTDDIDLSALREMEAQGMTRGEIAAALETTTATIRKYLGPGKRGRIPGKSPAKRLPPEPKPEPVLSLQERLQKEIEEGKRTPPDGYVAPKKTLTVKQRQTVLEGDLGSYTLDLIGKTVTMETVIAGSPATLADIRRFIRELEAVVTELGGETA